MQLAACRALGIVARNVRNRGHFFTTCGEYWTYSTKIREKTHRFCRFRSRFSPSSTGCRIAIIGAALNSMERHRTAADEFQRHGLTYNDIARHPRDHARPTPGYPVVLRCRPMLYLRPWQLLLQAQGLPAICRLRHRHHGDLCQQSHVQRSA